MDPERLLFPADVAERFGLTVAQFMELRRANDWPHVRLGRKVRFTEAQVAEIIRRQTPSQNPREEEIERLMQTGLTRRGAQAIIRRRERGGK